MTDYAIFKKVRAQVPASAVATKDELTLADAEPANPVEGEDGDDIRELDVWVELPEGIRTIRQAVDEYGAGEYAQSPRRSWKPESYKLEATARLLRG